MHDINEENTRADEANAEKRDVEASTDSSEAPQVSPKRMKWGRVVEEPVEEPRAPPPAAETHEEEKREEARPDPRLEALRLRLLREEQERREEEKRRAEARARQATEVGAAENASAPSRPSDKVREKEKPQRTKKRKAPERVSGNEKGTRGARPPESDDEVRRMEEELYREELRRRVRKKRRREAFLELWMLLLGALLSLPRRLRVSKKFVIALVATLLLSAIAAVILGNLLGDRVAVGDGDDETTAPQTEESEEPFFSRGFDVPEVNAGIVSLEGATVSQLRGEARRFYNAGATAVSLLLRDGDGELLFSSRADAALGIDRGEETLPSIDEILAPFLEYELYVSCILPMRYGIDGDAYSRSVLYAYETELLAEIADAGAHEVVLVDCDALFLGAEDDGEDALTVSAESVALELRGIARRLNDRVPETAVGIAFSPAFLATRDSDRYLSSIAEAFDLVLLDLRDEAEESDLYAAVSAGISDHLYFVLRYSMRILIPEGSAEAVSAVSVGNWQEGTLPSVIPDENG